MSKINLEDATIKQWLSNLEPRTRRNYLEQIPHFLEFVKQTPSEIIAQRKEQIKSDDDSIKRHYEDKLIAFKNSLEGKDRKISTVRSYLRTVMSFFSQNHVALKFAKKELKVKPSAKDKVIKEWIPTNAEVRQIYRTCRNVRDRAVLLTLYQSGISEIDVSSLNIEDFEFYDKNGEWIPKEHLYMARLREKTNIELQTALSIEALDELKIYLQTRGYPKSGALFLGAKGERIQVEAINDLIKACVERAFPERKLWLTKHLRDAYKNALIQAKLTQELADAMFGHQRQGARKEYGLSSETILLAYADVFKFLTVNGYGSQQHKLEELETKISDNEQRLTNMVSQQQKKIEEQADTLKQLGKALDLIATELERIAKTKEQPKA